MFVRGPVASQNPFFPRTPETAMTYPPRSAQLCLALLALLSAGSTTLRAVMPVGSIELFNGKDLTGWSLVTNPSADIAAVCHVTPEGVLAVAGKPVGYLLADGTYTNYRLHAEWRWPADAAKSSNSGFLVFIASGPIDRKTWPLCFQVQTKLNRAGDLLPMAGATFAEPLSTKPGAMTPQLDRRQPSSEKPLGQWNECDIVCRDGSIECTVNGVLQNRVTGCRPASGKFGIQLEGTPYELRNIVLTPLN
jgi:hypothetical protein